MQQAQGWAGGRQVGGQAAGWGEAAAGGHAGRRRRELRIRVLCGINSPHLSCHACTAGRASRLGTICALCATRGAAQRRQSRRQGGSTRRRRLQSRRNQASPPSLVLGGSLCARVAGAQGLGRLGAAIRSLARALPPSSHLPALLHYRWSCAYICPLSQGQGAPSQHPAAHGFGLGPLETDRAEVSFGCCKNRKQPS